LSGPLGFLGSFFDRPANPAADSGIYGCTPLVCGYPHFGGHISLAGFMAGKYDSQVDGSASSILTHLYFSLTARNRVGGTPMRNFINIRDNNVIAAADRVIVAAVDVIRNGFASRVRLYCQTWQHCAHTALKHAERECLETGNSVTGRTGGTSPWGRFGLSSAMLSPIAQPALPGLLLVPSLSRWMRSPGSLGRLPRS